MIGPDGPARPADGTDGLIVRISHDAPTASDSSGTYGSSKRAAIVRAATELFLRHGYEATTTAQIAAGAGVSKQTVYHQFGDKQGLFREIILGVTATVENFVAGLPEALGGLETTDDVRTGLRALARRYLASVVDPHVLALRRLVISEVSRFPDLAAAYYENAPQRVLRALAEQFSQLAQRGLLSTDDPETAADDFAALVLGRPVERGMFHIDSIGPGVDRLADHAADVFLASYLPPTTPAAILHGSPATARGH